VGSGTATLQFRTTVVLRRGEWTQGDKWIRQQSNVMDLGKGVGLDTKQKKRGTTKTFWGGKSGLISCKHRTAPK